MPWIWGGRCSSGWLRERDLAMASQLIESHRKGAEIYHGNDLCKEKTMLLLSETNLPNNLLPLEDIEEVGYNRETGFVWLIQKKKRSHMFEEIKQLVSYAAEVTAFVEERRLKKITGVKARELLIWFTIADVSIDERSPDKITFKTTAGLSDTFPVSAFQIKPADTVAVRPEVETIDLQSPSKST